MVFFNNENLNIHKKTAKLKYFNSGNSIIVTSVLKSN